MTLDTSSAQTELPATDQALLQAVVLHQAGELQAAEKLYLAILDVTPNHPEANHNMGALSLQMSRPAESLPYFMAALEADPTCAQYWLSYIDALFQAGQPEEARQVLKLAQEQGLEGDRVDALAFRLEGGEQATGVCEAEIPDTRRHNRTQPPGNEKEPSRQQIDRLVSLFTEGRLQEAHTLALELTRHFPAHGVGWKALGAVYMQMGQSANALQPMQKAAALSPDDAEAHNNLGIALYASGRVKEAEASYRRALQISPSDASAHSNLGAALQRSGRLDEAEACYRHALRINPAYAKALSNLGSILQESARLDEAEACYRRALQNQPANAETLQNLSITLRELGRLNEAEDSCRLALQIKPEYVDAHYHLGNILYDQNRLEEAEASYRRALQIQPDFVGVLNNLALLFNAQGKSMLALHSIRRSLQIEETVVAKSIFIACVKHLCFTHDDREIRSLIVRALTEPWGRPGELARISIDLIKFNPHVSECITRARDAWPQCLAEHDLYGRNGHAAVTSDGLLCALLESSPICDVEMERFLTVARHALLDAVIENTAPEDEESLHFYSAIARQNFINEYVFACTDNETSKANELQKLLVAALEKNSEVPVLWLIVLASYFPLYSIPHASRLMERQWPGSVTAVLLQQVREPAAEQELRSSISCLTDVENDVSLLVQNQYEENPYPRWVKMASTGEANNIVGYLCQKFPVATFNRNAKSGNIDILVAGCGTGQQSIGTAQRTPAAKILAIDLSMSSLGYAKRKTLELDIASIDYAQADILKLGSLERRFEVIESTGVLHHMADPWAGWQLLVSLLHPGGFMKIGLYSEAARSDIVRIRSYIAEKKYGSTPNEIRQCRQDLMDEDADFGAILSSPDFFSTSACRDLLFHVQEHRMTLTEIGTFLHNNDLQFLGFEIDNEVIHAYKQRFPDDAAATNLSQWQKFEHEKPDTFANMYQFWVQKSG